MRTVSPIPKFPRSGLGKELDSSLTFFGHGEGRPGQAHNAPYGSGVRREQASGVRWEERACTREISEQQRRGGMGRRSAQVVRLVCL